MALCCSSKNKMMQTNKRFIICETCNLWLFNHVIIGYDMVLIRCNYNIFIENYFIQHVVLEISCGSIEIHDFEDLITGQNDDILFLLNENLSYADHGMRKWFLFNNRPSIEKNTIKFIAYQIKSFSFGWKLHEITLLFKYHIIVKDKFWFFIPFIYHLHALTIESENTLFIV